MHDPCAVIPLPSSSRTQSNDTRAFGAGLAALRRELLSHALRLTHDAGRAEDLVQDTMERALRFEDHFEQGTNLRAWVHHILANVHVSGCRRRARDARAMRSLASDPCSWTAQAPREDASKTLSRRTRSAIEALPQPFQSTLVRVDLGDESYKDAADALGVPVGTVMSRLHRARRLLSEALQDAELGHAA